MRSSLLSRPALVRPSTGLSALALAILIVAGCGGGGSDTVGGSATSATGVSVGAIEGFGSIIVNGVRYDDSTAKVVGEDDSPSASDALKLGMVVEVEHTGVSRDAAGGTDRSHADRIVFGSALVGPASAIDAVDGTLEVLGQKVTVSSSTVFDSDISNGLAGLTEGQVVNVHGLFDKTSQTTAATRIELKPNAPFYRAKGVVSALDLAGKTLQFGAQVIDFSQVTGTLPSDLADGAVLRVVLDTAPNALGQWVARKLKSGAARIEDHHSAEVEGFVTTFTSASSFVVNGLTVDASASSFPNGQEGVRLGARVEVEGTVVNGVLVATKVEVKQARAARGLELHGAITAADATLKTFDLRGLTVNYSDSVALQGGSLSGLIVGARVEVRGSLSDDRKSITATSIRFER